MPFGVGRFGCTGFDGLGIGAGGLTVRVLISMDSFCESPLMKKSGRTVLPSTSGQKTCGHLSLLSILHSLCYHRINSVFVPGGLHPSVD